MKKRYTRTEGVTAMELVFDDSYPAEQLSAEFWEEQLLMAQAEWLLRQMDLGKSEPPRAYDE